MSAKKKILLIVGSTLWLLTIFVILMVTVNFRDYGIKNATEKAKITAEIVRDGLTAHMVNNMMHEREYFLNKITSLENVKDLWLVRSQSVIQQFGPGLKKEHAKDSLDNEVLKSGKEIISIKESSDSVLLRVSIPYIADEKGIPNCLSCHEAKNGDVLGAISMEIDVSDIRKSGLVTIIKVVTISIILLILAMYIANKFINPYLELFESLVFSIKKAYDGDFSIRVKTKLKDEGGVVANWLNNLFNELQKTIEGIDEKITILVAHRENRPTHPLMKAKSVVDELVDIYNFKKSIESEQSRIDIYIKLANELKNKVGLNDFVMFEVDLINKKRELVYATSPEAIGCAKDLKDSQNCAAVEKCCSIFSNEYSENRSCQYLINSEEITYMCIPFAINESKTILINIKQKDKEAVIEIKNNIPIIESFLEASKAVIESKLLNDILKESSLRDPLTKLYNRKFLDEFIDKSVSQAKRSNINFGILLIDIDYFKMVNDTFGHDAGDVVIKGLSNVLTSNIRESDLAIRFGGEEFLVLLYNVDEDGAMKVAEKLRESFSANPYKLAGNDITKTISIGVSIFPQDTDLIWKAIKFADIALYKAKQSGRNRVVRFQESFGTDFETY
ncbi:MAG: GGDEF domain-containing protein [Campylobacterales bacterium]|nr:GGDEF domain-containing protein [Campylobacterales bacterium]